MSAHDTQRQRDVNYGDHSTLTGGEDASLAWINGDVSAGYTIEATARVEGPDAELAHVAPVLTVERGHGGASLTTDYPLVRRLRLPVAASMIKVSGKLRNLRTGNAPPRSVTALVSLFIARGISDEGRNTNVVAQTGAEGLVATGPQRVLHVRGFNVPTGVPALDRGYLMLFDAPQLPLGANATPTVVLPAFVASPTGFSARPMGTYDFHQGVVWAASLDGRAFSPAPQAHFHVELELLR